MNLVSRLRGGEQTNNSWISSTYLSKNNVKALNTLLNSADYTITREGVFLFPWLKILLGQKQWWTQWWCCGVRSI
jgi:hypothetical protein